MAGSRRLNVAARLAKLGLMKCLIAVKKDGVYEVSQIRSIDHNVNLKHQGKFSSDHAPVIGRVGVAVPQLGVGWQGVMPFYGKWYDDIGETDTAYQIRKGIASLSESRLLEQVARDDQFALVADFVAAFKTIIEVKGRVPLVLIDSTQVDLTSFPVILPRIDDENLERKLLGILKIMLKTEATTDPDPLANTSGIEVDEG